MALWALGLLAQSLLAEPVRFETVGSARPTISVYRDKIESPLMQCIGRCSADLPVGRYRVAIAPATGTYEYDDFVTIRRPTKILLDPGDKVTRRTAITFGSILIGLSIPIALFGLIGVNGKGSPAIAVAGGIVFAGGLSLCIVAGAAKPSITAMPL